MEHVLIVGGEWILIALVFAGAVPELAMTCQFLLAACHAWRNDYGACERVASATSRRRGSQVHQRSVAARPARV
jgi:hypothetical protein